VGEPTDEPADELADEKTDEPADAQADEQADGQEGEEESGPNDEGKQLLKEFIEVNIVQTAEQEEEEEEVPAFDWEIALLTPTQLNIQMKFEDPLAVSRSVDFKDRVAVLFKFDDFEPIIVEEKALLVQELPKLLPATTLSNSINELGSAVQYGSTAIAATAVTANLFMSAVLSQVWGMINSLQIFIHFPLFKVQFPDNA